MRRPFFGDLGKNRYPRGEELLFLIFCFGGQCKNRSPRGEDLFIYL